MTASAVPERTEPLARRRGSDGAWPAALWATYASRVIVWVAAMIALALSPPARSVVASFDPSGLTHPFHSAVLNRLLAPSARYDTVWYLGIAQHGYFTDQAHAFFPLYPLIIKAIDVVVNEPLIVGFLVSLLCFSGSLVLLYRLALLDVGPRRPSSPCGCSPCSRCRCTSAPSTRSRSSRCCRSGRSTRRDGNVGCWPG